MTINELNLQISQLEAELAHAEVHVSTALEAEARAIENTKKAQNAVADIQFSLERHARLREQLTETPKPVDVASPLGAAIQKAVRGCYAHQWAAVILDGLASPRGLSHFSLSALSTLRIPGYLSTAQCERVWRVLEEHCPVIEETRVGIRRGMPVTSDSDNVSDTQSETPAPTSASASAPTADLTLEAAVRKAVGGKYAQWWAPAIIQQLAEEDGLSRIALDVLRNSSSGKFRKLSETQADRVWEILCQRCPKVSESLYHGISLGMPKS